MPWARVRQLIGPGPLWLVPRETFQRAIQTAGDEGDSAVQQHLQIMLERRDAVMLDAPKNTPGQPG